MYTDHLLSYKVLEADYIQEVIHHSAGYVRGHVHTNGTESFWSSYKLDRYPSENVQRFNTRAHRDDVRFTATAGRVPRRRVT